MNHSKVTASNIKRKRRKPMQKQSMTKQELEDSRSIRKVNLLPVSKVDDLLIRLENLKLIELFCKIWSISMKSTTKNHHQTIIQMNLLKIKKQKKSKGS